MPDGDHDGLVDDDSPIASQDPDGESGYYRGIELVPESDVGKRSGSLCGGCDWKGGGPNHYSAIWCTAR